MNTTQNDIKIEAAIIEARALLEEIPGVDSILGAWDVYCAHMDGPWVNVGPYPEDGYNSPNPQDQRIGLQILVDIYNRLAPFEDRIISLFNILDLAHLGYKDEIVRHNLACLKIYCNDFHSNQITIKALGLLDGQEQKRKQKQPSPKKQSKAAARLQSQELQEVKAKLIAAGIIIDGVWQGTPAEFGCLVLELYEYRGITNGGKAWTDCKTWAGYKDSIKSARNAIDSNPTTRGPIADKIRMFCRAAK